MGDAALGTLGAMAQDTGAHRTALAEAALALASEMDTPVLLQRIVDLAREVAGATYGALGILGPDGTLSDFLTAGISPEQRAAIGNLPRGGGILGVLITDATPLRLERIADDPRSVGFPANHPPMNSFLGVPVAARGRVFGNLYLTEKRGGGAFTQEDEDAVVELAAHAGVAVERARMSDELQVLALMEDRERIAKEIHDDVIQSLFAEGMALQAALSMTHDPDAIETRLNHAVDNIDRVIRSLRNYIFALRPGMMADRQLDIALRRLAQDFEGGAAIAVRTEPEAVALLAGQATDILQAAREALSNAVRHGLPSNVTLVLERRGDALVLEVADDGKGFDPAAVAGEGHGLGNLRARADSLGGTLTISSEPDAGTVVTIEVPAR